MEEAFSKVKASLRKATARTREALVDEIGRALGAVTPQDAPGDSPTAAARCKLIYLENQYVECRLELPFVEASPVSDNPVVLHGKPDQDVGGGRFDVLCPEILLRYPPRLARHLG